jgi:predicted MPP superfamily phosphohydrolase
VARTRVDRYFQPLDDYLGAFSPLQSHRLNILVAITAVGALVGVLSLTALLATRLSRRRLPNGVRRAALVGLTPLVVGALVFLVGLIEPHWLDVTHTTVASDHLPDGVRLRIALLSDLHVSGWTPVLRELPDRVNAEKPDLVVFTGDAVNEAQGVPIFRSVLSAMKARYGRYGVRGNHDLDWYPDADLFADGALTELKGEPIVTADGLVSLCGASFPDKRGLKQCLLDAEPGFQLVAYHTPDLIRKMEPLGVDLYLAGHTHGGQFRLPFYGAVITMSEFDKEYESGLHTYGDTTLYVNRGIGESPHLLPIRFLCRPELSIIDVQGTGRFTPAVPPTVRMLRHDGEPLAPQRKYLEGRSKNSASVGGW